MKLISDIDGLLKGNKKLAIRNLLISMYLLHKERGDKNSFLLTRTYQIKGVSEHTQRKVLGLLTRYKFVRRHLHYFHDKHGVKKRGYYYNMDSRLYRICYDLLRSRINYISLSINLGISDIKKFIKNIYTNTVFTIKKEYGIVKHIFNLKGNIYKLSRGKGLPIISSNDGSIYNIIEFNNLIMKQK